MITEHQCKHEDKIAKIDKIEEIHALCKRMDEGLRGNGKPGLFTEFAVWKSTVCGLMALDVIIVGGLIALWLKS